MVMANKRGFVLCLVISMDVLGAAAGILRPPPMYVFGESTLDVGNNNFLPGPNVFRANAPYYGIDFPGVPTGRFSNGNNIADFLAKRMGFWSSPPPYLMLEPNPELLVSTALEIGVNYASGGSGILDSTNSSKNIPLSKQVQYFKATRAKMAAATGDAAVMSTLLARSVFLISDGNNDLTAFATSPQQRQSDAATFLADLISNYSATITELYGMGARKFAIVNAGLIGCAPAGRVAGACAVGINQLAAGFNVALNSLLAEKKKQLPDMAYSLADSYGLMHDFFTDPQAWGFTDIASACCTSGWLLCLPTSKICPTRSQRDQHVFWDSFHFSQRACFLTAQAFYDGPAKYTTPINFMQLAQQST
ncbi:unnamed protein product [Urochloa decumbens]|uniref:GDSL esterase/lipase n=1 Tax=Urochloa decumbens TaxID=240449 RepID=A0ABC8ZUZ1_9POAL